MKIRIKTSEISRYYTDLELGPLAQTLIHNLGLSDEEAHNFLNCHTSELADPFLIYGMQEAVDVITEAIESGVKIAIHGDFDVDGVSATSIMWDYLYYERGVDTLPIIPHRVDEGYGLSEKTIEKAINWGAKLLITVDCGIKDAAIVERYKDQIDFVITDHHQFATDENGEIILPRARAVVHSAHPKSKYPCMISGGATSWQLVKAIELKRQKRGQDGIDPELAHKYLDLVALTTICDIIPLTIENRKLVQRGLKKVAENRRVGLAELLKVSAIEPSSISAYHFGFVLGPRLNAPGRVTNDAMDALRLLSTRNSVQAAQLAERLQELNLQRQELTAKYVELAERMIDPAQRAIVVLGEEWPEGLLGLIAGKLAEKYFRPAFVAAQNHDGHITGSARSPLDIVPLNHVLEHASAYLTRFGGHKQAAGFASTRELFDGFGEKVNEYVAQSSSPGDFQPELVVDIALDSLHDISIKDIEELSLLEPHGLGNPKPLFQLTGCTVASYSCIGREAKHLKLLLEVDGFRIDAIGFNMAEKYQVSIGQKVDVIGSLAINEWNGTRKIQLELKHIL